MSNIWHNQGINADKCLNNLKRDLRHVNIFHGGNSVTCLNSDGDVGACSSIVLAEYSADCKSYDTIITAEHCNIDSNKAITASAT